MDSTQSIATQAGLRHAVAGAARHRRWRRNRRPAAATLIACIAASGMLASAQPPPPGELGIKYVRDSNEYSTTMRQTYRVATDAVARLASGLAGRDWAVVLDIDETALDNSAYQLERAAYGLPFDAASWSAWVQRREASAVPGAIDFIVVIRKLGGRIAADHQSGNERCGRHAREPGSPRDCGPMTTGCARRITRSTPNGPGAPRWSPRGRVPAHGSGGRRRSRGLLVIRWATFPKRRNRSATPAPTAPMAGRFILPNPMVRRVDDTRDEGGAINDGRGMSEDPSVCRGVGPRWVV